MELSAFDKEFSRFQPELRSFLFRLTANRQLAEDLSQDSYLKARENLKKFRGESSLKTWVFSIASNLAKDEKRVQQRWGEDWMDKVKDVHISNPTLMQQKMQTLQSSPEAAFVISEHINYCLSCTTKTLSLIQQLCLWLKDVYSFKVDEICEILELSEGKVKHALAEARQNLTRIFKNKCALVNQKGACHQCSGLNKMYNPEEAEAEALNEIRLYRERELHNHETLLQLRLDLARSLDPLNGKTEPLHSYLFEGTPTWAN